MIEWECTMENEGIETSSVSFDTSKIVKVNNAEVNSQNICKILCSSSVLVRQALSPLTFALKIFGLNFGAYCPLVKKIDKIHRVSLIYSIFVIILLSFNVIRYMFSFIYNKQFSVYLHLEYFLWFIKCTVQAGYCLYLCRRSSEDVLSKIQQLILDYDKTLNWFSTPDQATRKNFLFRSRIILGTLFTIISINNIVIYVGFFGPYRELNSNVNPFLHPFPTNQFTKVLYCIIHTYNSVAWVFPIILYCLLCNSLCLVFNQLYVGIESMDEQLTMKKHIKEIRRQYVHMNQLCGRTDDVIGFLAICVYLLDIILFCLNLYHLIYLATNHLEKAMAGFWVTIALGNLFVMSLCASYVHDKVRNFISTLHFLSHSTYATMYGY